MSDLADVTVLHQSAILLILTILFVPETAYKRKDVSTMQASQGSFDGTPWPSSTSTKDSVGSEELSAEISREKQDSAGSSKDDSIIHIVEEEIRSVEPKESFVHSLRPWNGQRFSHEGFLKIAKRPFAISLSPAVLRGALVYGTTNAWCECFSLVSTHVIHFLQRSRRSVCLCITPLLRPAIWLWIWRRPYWTYIRSRTIHPLIHRKCFSRTYERLGGEVDVST